MRCSRAHRLSDRSNLGSRVIKKKVGGCGSVVEGIEVLGSAKPSRESGHRSGRRVRPGHRNQRAGCTACRALIDLFRVLMKFSWSPNRLDRALNILRLS